jgi:hypothetical protein
LTPITRRHIDGRSCRHRWTSQARFDCFNDSMNAANYLIQLLLFERFALIGRR